MMQGIYPIRSLQNQRLKECQKLLRNQGRRKQNRYRIETRKLVEEAVQSGISIDYILCTEEQVFFVQQMLREADHISIYVVPRTLFHQISVLEHPDGWLAVACGSLL